MDWFNIINELYNKRLFTGKRLWEIDRVKTAVKLNKITKEQFKEITAQDYTE